MKLLIATRNRDKFSIISRLIRAVRPESEIIPLYDTDLTGDVIEVGTMEERALQKAKFFEEKLSEAGRGNEFDGVLGIDDGIQVADGIPTPQSKELTDQLLHGTWPVGTSVSIIRAYSLIMRHKSPRIVTTHWPFTFYGNAKKITRTEGTYPLNHVLIPSGMTAPWSQLSDDVIFQFTFNHSKKELEKLLSGLDG